MAPGAGNWGWEEVCSILTGSLRTNGLFHWGEIRDSVGEDAYGDMQWLRGDSRVWVVDYADIAPRPRRSMLDYAHVAGAELYGASSRRHVMIGDPERVAPRSGAVPPRTCSAAEMGIEDHELAHHASRDTLNSANDGFVRDLMVSFRDKIILDVEEQIQIQAARALDGDFAFVDREGSEMSQVPPESRDPIHGGSIARAGIRVVRRNPQIPFPHGLVCMISPEQAMQLFGGDSVRMESMSAYGIDLVASPAVRFDGADARFMNIVAADRSIRVALSGIEVDAVRQDGGTVIKARYSMGVSVEPCMAAKIFSYRN